jgi:hypothetical protein
LSKGWREWDADTRVNAPCKASQTALRDYPNTYFDNLLDLEGKLTKRIERLPNRRTLEERDPDEPGGGQAHDANQHGGQR